MSKPYDYFRFVQFGTIGGSQDWSTGLALNTNPAADVQAADLPDFLADVESASASWWTTGTFSPQAINSADCVYIGNRIYYYAANGTTALYQAELSFTTPLVGDGGQSSDMRQCMVSSTLTGVSGRSFRGRRYLPATGVGLANHQFTNQATTQVSVNEGALMAAIKALTIHTEPVFPVIANNRDFPTNITQCRVDSKPDTQRRRSNKESALFTITTAF